MDIIRRTLQLTLAVAFVWGQLLPPSAAEEAAPPALFKPEEIDQLVAPIALYPDPLLAQIFMASTYPLEIVQAARWSKDNPNLKDKALEDALQQQSWDPSVKSLTAFPQVLVMMNDQLDWTQKLGDAVLAQQKDVMAGVQRLRAKANAEGNLKTTPEQKVVVEAVQAPAQQNITVQQAPAPTQVIKIEPADPQVVYVPTYNPTQVYGAWPAPAYPPHSYYPPGYTATASVLSFGVGMAVGAAAWGNCDWGHGDVNYNVNNYNNFNKTNISNSNWQHNAEHRKGAQYRDPASQQKYGRGAQANAQSREAFRGRAEQGRQQMARGEGGARPGATAERGGGQGARQGARQPQPASREAAAGGRRDTGQSRQAESFQGMGNGNQARNDSERGRASRQSASAQTGSSARGGSGASGGGGSGGRGGMGGGGMGGGGTGGGGGGGGRGGGGGGGRGGGGGGGRGR